MKTYLDCIPCFFRQLLEGARIANLNLRQQKQVIDEFARKIPKVSLFSSPPEIARIGYNFLKKISSDKDPYETIKKKSNYFALELLDKLRNKVNCSQDRLFMALALAIAGNIIDFGVKNDLNVEEELGRILAKEDITTYNKTIFHYAKFKQILKNAKNILYLADNAGETVFDRILIEEIKRIDGRKEVVYAVKEKPVINDALIEDAFISGIDKIAKVISSGSDAPGTVLSLCSKEFLRIYKKADMIISKGQGNFEVLSKTAKPIFFLFMAKCPVVAKNVGCKIGDIILKYHNSRK
jgi:uncharacterized protein with ATP-grasp and redox domains